MELFKERKRFSDLLEIDSSLSSKVLSERLKELFDNNIIEKIVINMIPFKFKYQLTEQGRALNKIFFECAQYSCLYFPNKIFDAPPEKKIDILNELREIFKIDTDY